MLLVYGTGKIYVSGNSLNRIIFVVSDGLEEWSDYSTSGSEYEPTASDGEYSDSDSSVYKRPSKLFKTDVKKMCSRPKVKKLKSRSKEAKNKVTMITEQQTFTDLNSAATNIQARYSPQPSCSHQYVDEAIPNDPQSQTESVLHTKGSINDQNAAGKNVGKKRRRRPETWKRYVKSNNSFGLLQRRPINDCRCKCNTKLNEQEQNFIFEHYKSLSTHTEQNIYLKGCTEPSKPQRTRCRTEGGKSRSFAFKYKVQVARRSVTVCQKAFLCLHGIKRSRLRRKVLIASSSVKDARGTHETRPKRLNLETLHKVKKFIEELPARESHYSRSQNRLKKYLDSHLSVAELHRRFTTQNGKLITYEMFRKIFTEEYNISFGFPRKDICRVCTNMMVMSQKARLDKDENKEKSLKVSKELHLRKAEVFQKAVKSVGKEINPNVLAICFDYQKNLPVPVTNIQDEYYLRQLWVHNFGIKNLSTSETTMYMYAEHFAQKGPNEVISCLEDFILQNKTETQKILKLYCDNCFSQNKNRFLFAFLDQLCLKTVFEKIEVLYPIPGHSMMPIDRDFGLIEKRKLKVDTVDNPEFYVNLIKECNRKHPFKCVFVQHSLRSDGGLMTDDRVVKIKDFKGWFESHLKASVPGISKARYIEFFKGGHPKIKEAYNAEPMEVKLYRVGHSRQIPGVATLAYGDEYLTIKDAKLSNVIHLMGFITSGDTDFYDRTLINKTSVPRVPIQNEGQEAVDSDTDIYE